MKEKISSVIYTVAFVISLGITNAQAQEVKTVQVQENLYFVGDRVFSCFYITESSVIVIDPLNERLAKETLSAIRNVTDKPINYVFYSHNHWDHISGGEVFQREGARFISHAMAEKHIAPNPKVIMPDSTWNGSFATFQEGGYSLELYYFGQNHGNGMTVFRFPEHNAIFVIDLVVPDRVLYAYLPDASPKNWVKHLAEIQQLTFEDVYMAHVRVKGNRSDITFMQQYFNDLYAAVDQALADGTPFFDIPNEVKLPQYSHLKNYDEWLHMNVWRILMEKAIGQ